MESHLLVGWIAVIIYILGSIPYFWDTLRGKTRPNRVTWFGWALLSWTAALIQSAHGADASVLIVYASALILTAIFGLSLYRGDTTFSLVDVLSLTLGGIAYVFWLVLDAPIAALCVNIAADFLFGVPTIVKVWQSSESESKLSWFIGFMSMTLALFSKTQFDFINTAFPLYLFCINGLIFALSTGVLQPYQRRVRR